MSSGIKPSAKCEATYKEMKMNHCYRYVLFQIIDNEISVIKIAPRDETMSQFKDEVSKYQNKGCYGVVDYECEGGKGANLIYFSLVSDSAPPTARMLYATTRKSLSSCLDGLKADIEAHDINELMEKLETSAAADKNHSKH
ncbi:unnamed protein product [Schistosoma rodhaini]|uniref:Cofilin n=2 Tax=Schistosoma TaxID=6181 RepID=G4LZY0_SCHMA|nr:cofilin [Schistosoma mansoni]CAH8679858.1 unnamed protein product [Schistosoma rodhaini]CAH8682202.1 unnamed protein product [Schistosoma rodhaini]|eukprot:XP_018646798.1 cofilin [Schistosoma mansoni]